MHPFDICLLQLARKQKADISSQFCYVTRLKEIRLCAHTWSGMNLFYCVMWQYMGAVLVKIGDVKL